MVCSLLPTHNPPSTNLAQIMADSVTNEINSGAVGPNDTSASLAVTVEDQVNDNSEKSVNPASLEKNAEKNEAKRRAKMEKFLAKQEKSGGKLTPDLSSSASEKKPSKTAKAITEEKPKSEAITGTQRSLTQEVTALGEKKQMTAPLASAYDPLAVESSWYSWWEAKGFFQPENNRRHLDMSTASNEDKFTIVIPPPNVTGSLHLGHALTNSIEDALCRWHRMRGKIVLWVPGTDHAGIATQVTVEKRLMKMHKKTRHDLGREDFLKEVWRWKEEYGNRIHTQLKRLGSSCDWSRVRFTMDPMLQRAVTEAFCRYYESGTIYRSTRLVNWCCTLKTAISNLEVEHKEINGRLLMPVIGHDSKNVYEFGVLHSFAYKLIKETTASTNSADNLGDDEESFYEADETKEVSSTTDTLDELVVATTRIETMLGDTGIAVHPEDDRYKVLFVIDCTPISSY